MQFEVPPADPGDEARDRARARGIEQRLAKAALIEDPYPHFVLDEVLDPEFAGGILDWLEAFGVWQEVAASFYVIQRCTNLIEISRSAVNSIVQRPVIETLAAELGRIFGAKVGSRWLYMAANRMDPGQGIYPHADPPDQGGENFRLVVHLGRQYRLGQGGDLMLLRAKDHAAVFQRVAPLHGASVGFVLSDRSFHAVDEVRAGVRYTLVFGFYEAGRVPDDLAVGRAH